MRITVLLIALIATQGCSNLHRDSVKEMKTVAEKRHLSYQIVHTNDARPERAFLAKLCPADCSFYNELEDDGTGGIWAAFGPTQQEAATTVLKYLALNPKRMPVYCNPARVADKPIHCDPTQDESKR